MEKGVPKGGGSEGKECFIPDIHEAIFITLDDT